MKFKMTAECQPKNAATWFDGFQDGGEFEAECFDAANEWLNSQCAEAGTDSDPHYADFGPAAKFSITSDDEDGICEWLNCAEASVDKDGDVWVEGPMSGHWLSEEKREQYIAWRDSVEA